MDINGKLFLYYMCICINFLYISFCAYILQHSSLNLLSLHYSNKEHDCRDKQNYEEEHKQTPVKESHNTFPC